MNVYKKISKTDLENRNVNSLDNSTKETVRNTILNFKNYFKLKHLT
jgi:hypothetical protein